MRGAADRASLSAGRNLSQRSMRGGAGLPAAEHDADGGRLVLPAWPGGDQRRNRCPPGQEQGPGGACVAKCLTGWIRASSGQCCLFSQLTAAGACCAQGQAPQANGTCCPVGQEQGPGGGCVPKCPGGWAREFDGQCCPAFLLTSAGSVPAGPSPATERIVCAADFAAAASQPYAAIWSKRRARRLRSGLRVDGGRPVLPGQPGDRERSVLRPRPDPSGCDLRPCGVGASADRRPIPAGRRSDRRRRGPSLAMPTRADAPQGRRLRAGGGVAHGRSDRCSRSTTDQRSSINVPAADNVPPADHLPPAADAPPAGDPCPETDFPTPTVPLASMIATGRSRDKKRPLNVERQGQLSRPATADQARKEKSMTKRICLLLAGLIAAIAFPPVQSSAQDPSAT